jgi:CheY-like chemotaxis protein
MNRKKILVVDDDAVVVQALTGKLKANDYDVVSAMDGAAAVTAARKEKPDLILLDINFPPDVGSGLWDGLRIMTWLKRLDEVARIPIVVITGGEPGKYEEKAKAAGATAFFHKDKDHKELLTVIQKALGENPPSE